MNWLQHLLKISVMQNPRSDLTTNPGGGGYGGSDNHEPVPPIVLPFIKRKRKIKGRPYVNDKAKQYQLGKRPSERQSY
jgi:hypothetical protein